MDRATAMTHSSATLVRGRVTAVRGTVLEIGLDGALPPLSAAVRCRLSRDQWITAVVHAHIGGGTVRAIALESTRRLMSLNPDTVIKTTQHVLEVEKRL